MAVMFIGFFLVIGGVSAKPSFAATAPIDEVPSAILHRAQQILHDATDSLYAHKTDVDESRGRYHFDCSGMAYYIIKQLSPAHARILAKGLKKRPLARHFYQVFVDADVHPIPGRWQRIERLLDARPGDVLAWRRIKLKPHSSTGHVMIIASAPVPYDDDTIGIDVIDSTGSGHGDDTRAKGQSGIGRGTMWFDVDSAGRPIAYHWRKPDGKATTAPIAIGRAIGQSHPSTQRAR